MDFAQNALTVIAEIVAIAGFAGIVADAALKAFRQQPMQEEVSVAPTTQAIKEPAAPEQAEAPQEPAKVEPEPAIAENEVDSSVELTEVEIDASFKVPVLRALCDKYSITWQHQRGRNKHMLKPAMIQALMNANAF